MRQKVTSALKQAKAPKKQNLSSSQTKALNGLRTDHNILIIKADKGNSTVVMDRSDYMTQVKEMLQDSKVYKKITDKRRNPTTRTENDLQKMLKTLCDSGHLSELDYWKLRPSQSP